MKKITAFILIICFISSTVFAKDINEISAKSFILLDGEAGNVLLENNADESLPPASITKIMTMLLLMEAVDKGVVSLDDIVTVSETAALHEGSHVFLEIGEQITVSDLLKAIAVASGNDASVAVAELLCGTQAEFVNRMNERAKELGLNNTNFVNCNGLDADGHVSSARDIAIMTCELLKHNKILEYTTIWTDSLRNGTFNLANTNKLIRFYEGANGMKTGSTSKAGYCLSATALRDNMQLIAVVLGSATSKDRFADASTLLNYGFSNYSKINLINKGEVQGEVTVEKGTIDKISVITEKECDFIVKNDEKNNITNEIILNPTATAPVKKGEILGKIVFRTGEREVGSVNLVSKSDSAKISLGYLLNKFINSYLNTK